MERREAKESILCFANYLAAWADWFDNLGHLDVANGITHVAVQLTREAAQIRTDGERTTSNERKSSAID